MAAEQPTYALAGTVLVGHLETGARIGAASREAHQVRVARFVNWFAARPEFRPSESSGIEHRMEETMLRVANVGSEADLEAVRDALDEIGADYEHVNSEPNEDAYPQTAYFQIQSGLTEDADNILAKLSKERGLDAEIL